MPATDDFQTYEANLRAPFENGAAVAPNDAADLGHVTRALWVGGLGNVVVTMKGGGDVTFAGVPAGTLLDIRVSRVKATGTTATSIVALW